MKITTPRNLLWFLPLAAIVTSPLWLDPVSQFLAPRGGYDPRFAGRVSTSPAQNFTLDTVSITMTTKGMEEWQIDAQQAYTTEKDNEIELVGVSAMYIGKDKPPTNITSKKGRYLVLDRELVLMEDVRIKKPTSRQELRTELLHYYDATKMAHSPTNVQIVTDDFRLDAGSMDYDLSTDGYDFGNRVKVNL